jgi:hypothetical protein
MMTTDRTHASTRLPLEIQTRIERKHPVPGSRQRDDTEIGGIDIHRGIAEIRVIENIDRIQPEF